MSNDEPRGQYYPALTLESPTTPKQRARNYALYLRLRDGTPQEERTGTRDGVGLHVFQFEIPTASCHASSIGGEPTLSFSLARDGECYRRLLSYISDHFPNGCDADDEVERLTKDRDALAEQFRSAARLLHKAMTGGNITTTDWSLAESLFGLAEIER